MAQRAWGSNRGKDQRNLLTSGLVTYNVASGNGIADHRATNAGRQGFLAMPNEGKVGLSIKPFRLMLAYRDVKDSARRYARSNITRNMANFMMEPFTEFGGIKKSSEAEFRAQLVPIGFSADYHIYDEPSQADLGVAAIVSGSFTTVNTGLELWQPGDLIKWSPPPMKGDNDTPLDDVTEKFQQDRQKANAVTAENPNDHFPAVLTPFNFDTDVRDALKKRLQDKNDQTFKDGLHQALTQLRDLVGDDANATATNLLTADDKLDNVIFALGCKVIHDAMQQVVAKSLGFSLPGAGGDVVM